MFKKILITVAAAALFFWGADAVFAATPGTAPSAAQSADIKNQVVTTVAYLASLIVNVLDAFLWPFLMIIGSLMDNDLIVGPGMEERLRLIWSEVRNLVNIVFALFLLVVAVYNAMGFGNPESSLSIQASVPKIVLGLILVNFTFQIGVVVLDASSIATSAVFALPEAVEDQTDALSFAEKQKIIIAGRACLPPAKPDVPQEHYKMNDPSVPIMTQYLCAKDETKKEYTGEINSFMADNYFQSVNQNNISLLMAINMGSLNNQLLVKPESIKTFEDLTINVIFSFVTYVIFCLTYIVLALVLIARIVVMWLALALSPIAVLVYVIPQVSEFLGSGGGDLTTRVTKHLMAPIIIGLTLSISYIMMGGLADGGGAYLNSLSTFSADQLLSTQFYASGIESMQRFILMVVSIVVVWVGVFAAAEGTLAESITSGIKEVGENIAQGAARLPLYVPSIAISGEKDAPQVSPLALSNFVKYEANQLKYGEFGKGNVAQVFKGTLMEGEANRYAGASSNPDTNGSEIKKSLEGSVSKGDFKDIADRLYNTNKANGEKLSTGDQKVIEDMRQGHMEAPVALAATKKLVRDNTAEQLGLKQSDYDEIKKRVTEITDKDLELGTKTEPTPKVAAPAPTAAPAGTAPATTPAAGTGPANTPTPPGTAPANPASPATPTPPSGTPVATPTTTTPPPAPATNPPTTTPPAAGTNPSPGAPTNP